MPIRFSPPTSYVTVYLWHMLGGFLSLFSNGVHGFLHLLHFCLHSPSLLSRMCSFYWWNLFLYVSQNNNLCLLCRSFPLALFSASSNEYSLLSLCLSFLGLPRCPVTLNVMCIFVLDIPCENPAVGEGMGCCWPGCSPRWSPFLLVYGRTNHSLTPTPVRTALTCRQMHLGPKGDGMKK